MLFSHPDVARHMSQLFECAWESVRPVPHVTIDFGNGHTLERTLHGNIVTYLCTASGEVYDLIPGLVDPREYLHRLDQAIRLRRGMSFVGLVPPLAGDSASSSEPPPAPVHDPSRVLWTRWHEAVVARASAGELQGGDPINVFDGSKMRVEHRIDMALAPPMNEGDIAALAADTLHNRTHRYPLASQLLLERPFVRHVEITAEVYRRVLGVDLSDPYLGLAPEVLGGEGGRG